MDIAVGGMSELHDSQAAGAAHEVVTSMWPAGFQAPLSAGVDMLAGLATHQTLAGDSQGVSSSQGTQSLLQPQSLMGMEAVQQAQEQHAALQAAAAMQANLMQGGQMTTVDPATMQVIAHQVGQQGGAQPRFKPSQKQREEMENAVRAGGFKRKCKELEDYARQEGLPYKAVLSWFDRNKTRLMHQDVVTTETGDMMAVSGAPSRFKPTPEQTVGMENAARRGGLKRKCAELQQFAHDQGLPYAGVLSWFDRNRKKLMNSQGEAVVSGADGEGGIVLSQIPSVNADGTTTMQSGVVPMVADVETMAAAMQQAHAQAIAAQQQAQAHADALANQDPQAAAFAQAEALAQQQHATQIAQYQAQMQDQAQQVADHAAAAVQQAQQATDEQTAETIAAQAAYEAQMSAYTQAQAQAQAQADADAQ